jgi:hypothetical protein
VVLVDDDFGLGLDGDCGDWCWLWFEKYFGFEVLLFGLDFWMLLADFVEKLVECFEGFEA